MDVGGAVNEGSGLAVMKGDSVRASDWVAGGLRVRPLAVGRPVGDTVGATVTEIFVDAVGSIVLDCSTDALTRLLRVA